VRPSAGLRTGVGRVIGTAGHIDHGKTTLVRALTGIDTDRLKEEKERGITIELGFANLTLPSGERVGVVDVPGHEKFVRTMVAGAVGIDLVVLVVAADEGVMPQTREHLDICQLLGVARGVVALTKADTVDETLLEMASSDVAETLKGTFLEDAPIVPCSAKTGAGLDALKQAIVDGLKDAPGKDPDGLFRLPIDRVFSMKGFGTVVTGTLWAGTVRAGDDVVALPRSALPAKVRGVQVHGATVDAALAGQRTAINLSIPREALDRGETLVRANELEAGRLLDVRIRYLPTCKAPLKRRARVLFHAGTAQSLAQVTLLDTHALEPGRDALAQLQLEQPMVLLPGDRFILRGFVMQRHHGTTLGGGAVIRTLGARHRRGTPQLLAALRANEQAGPDERVRLEVERAGERGIQRHELQMRVPHNPKVVEAALTRLQGARQVVRFDKERGALIAAGALEALKQRALDAVTAFHAAQPLQAGMPREELRAKVTQDPRLLHVLLESLATEKKLAVEREVVRLPGHDARSSTAAQNLSPLAERVVKLWADAALQPPRPAEAAVALKCDVSELARAIDLLARGGTLVKVKDLVFSRQALDDLRARLVAHLTEKGTIDPQGWKEMVGASRKFAIPLAEYFDAEKVTLRVGDLRKLRGR
jgi:selenocysteine-specific elongation factor